MGARRLNHDSAFWSPSDHRCADALQQKSARQGPTVRGPGHWCSWAHTQTEMEKLWNPRFLFLFCFYESVYSVIVLDIVLKMVGVLTAVMQPHQKAANGSDLFL